MPGASLSTAYEQKNISRLNLELVGDMKLEARLKSFLISTHILHDGLVATFWPDCLFLATKIFVVKSPSVAGCCQLPPFPTIKKQIRVFFIGGIFSLKVLYKICNTRISCVSEVNLNDILLV